MRQKTITILLAITIFLIAINLSCTFINLKQINTFNQQSYIPINVNKQQKELNKPQEKQKEKSDIKNQKESEKELKDLECQIESLTRAYDELTVNNSEIENDLEDIKEKIK